MTALCELTADHFGSRSLLVTVLVSHHVRQQLHDNVEWLVPINLENGLQRYCQFESSRVIRTP